MLKDLPPEERTHPDVFSCRLAICTALEKWEMGLELFKAFDPPTGPQHRQDCAGFAHAYARHLCGQGDIEQAKEFVARGSRLWPDGRLAMIDDLALIGMW